MYNLYRVNLLHIFLIGPILLYIGYKKKETNYNIKLIFIGVVVMMPFIVRFPNINRLEFEHNRINLLHWTIILIFLSYICYNFYLNIELNNIYYNILLFTGLKTIIIHTYLLYNKIQNNKEKIIKNKEQIIKNKEKNNK